LPAGSGESALVADRAAPRWARAWWVVPAAIAVALAGLFLVVLPPHRTLESAFEVPWRLSPVLFAVVAIAGFPQRRGLGTALVGALFVAYMGAVDTALVLHVDDYVASSSNPDSFDDFYQFELFMSAFVLMAILFAFRLGGGRTTRTLQLGGAGVLVLISGLNDLTDWLLADWPDGRPHTLFWASHIKVFVGGSPSIPVAVTFLAIHLILAGLLLTRPVERWLDRALGHLSLG
jgi:hypothetical protein